MSEPRSRRSIRFLMIVVAISAVAIAYREPLFFLVQAVGGFIALVALLMITLFMIVVFVGVILEFLGSLMRPASRSGPGRPDGGWRHDALGMGMVTRR